MSKLLESLEVRFGKEVKLAGLFKKTSTVRTQKRVDFILKSDLDDRTKANYPDKSEVDGLSEEDFIEALFAGKANLCKGEDISPALPDCKVMACGYIQSELGLKEIGKKEMPIVSEYWAERTPEMDLKKAHHMIFSHDPRVSATFSEMGQNCHGHLVSCAMESLNKYQRQFYPDNELGYVMGFHSDRHHRLSLIM